MKKKIPKLCDDCKWCGDDFSPKGHRVTCLFLNERVTTWGWCEIKNPGVVV